MAKLCIYTHNSRLFYLLTKKFKEEKVPFTGLDSFNDLHPSAKVLLTTQQDLENFQPNLPNFIVTLIILPFEHPDEIFLKTLQYLHNIRNPSKITIAIDPGMEKTGLAIFLGNQFLYSFSVYNLKTMIYWIQITFNAFSNQSKLIKLGNGYPKLTRKFLFYIREELHYPNIEIMLINEKRTSKLKWRHQGNFGSIHEKSAMLIGLRTGKIISREQLSD